MFARTTIVLPPRLKTLASERAREQQLSFSEFVRRAVLDAVSKPQREGRLGSDPLLADRAVSRRDVPVDLSANHDSYLYGSEG
jgi:hypothetical protein